MVNPVPGYKVSTPYRRTGSHWTACGWHTGQDYAAPDGARVVAARAGVVAHVNYGSAFGDRQFAIRPGDGTEDFYAHTSTRPAAGTRVAAGADIARVSSRGNATGPHLHFERHSTLSWSCGAMADPMLSHNAPASGGSSPYPTPTSKTVYLSKLRYGQKDSDSVWYLQRALDMPAELWTGNYLTLTDESVRSCQAKHVPPADPPNRSNVGPKQAAHLWPASTGIRVVDDRANPV